MNAFEGWITPYKVDRPVSAAERSARLDPSEEIALPPIDRGIVRLNSSFMEYVDRHFFLRGWAALWGLPFLAALLLFAALFTHTAFAARPDGSPPTLFHTLFCLTFVAVIAAGVVFVWRRMILRDFFSLTYFPIRFDRDNAKVDAIVRDGSGGGREVSIAWRHAFFYVAPADRPDSLSGELRCNVMDESDSVVIHTFSVGNAGTRVQALQHWEMIRGFMANGVESLPFPPLDLYVSTKPTFRNAFLIHVAGFGDGLMRVLALPFTIPWAVSRFLAMQTCRAPAWPKSMSSADMVGESDSGLKREPSFMAQFQSESSLIFDRNMKYRREAEKAAAGYKGRRHLVQSPVSSAPDSSG